MEVGLKFMTLEIILKPSTLVSKKCLQFSIAEQETYFCWVDFDSSRIDSLLSHHWSHNHNILKYNSQGSNLRCFSHLLKITNLG